jgi:hypothetical protein
MLPADPKAALAMKQIEALADGIMDAALTSVREQAGPPPSSRKRSCYASGKKSTAAWIV